MISQKTKQNVHPGNKERHNMELEYATTSFTNSGLKYHKLSIIIKTLKT